MPNSQPTKKKPSNFAGKASLGLLGAGVGAEGLSRLVMGPNDMKAVHGFTDAATKSWAHGEDPRSSIIEYANEGNKALNATPMGTDANTLMGVIRNPKVLNMASKIPGLSGVKDFAMNPNAAQHYQQFAKSPLDGYLEINRELAGGNPDITHGYAKKTLWNLQNSVRANWLRRDGSEGQVNNFMNWNGGVPGMENDPASVAQYRAGVSKLFKDTSPGWNIPGFRTVPKQVDLGYYNNLKGLSNEYAQSQGINLATATTDQKRNVLAGLDHYIKSRNPDLWKQKQFTDFSLGNMMPNAGKTYTNMLINPLVQAHNGLHYGAMALGGLGAGLGGYALYKMLRHHLAKKKAQEAQQQPQMLLN